MSKGRPQCVTARTLTEIDYQGEWFIVVGDNDETVEEYRKLWGDKIIVFPWLEYAEKSDLLDNFGLEDLPSGAVPARNAIRDISKQRGESRHWQFDDDFTCFKIADNDSKKMMKIEDGDVLEKALQNISEFADSCKCSNAGFSTSTFERWEAAKKASRQVFCCHNLPSDDTFVEWKGRVGDDAINCYETYRHGGFEFSFEYLGYAYVQSCSSSGGNTELYEQTGYVRKCAYEVLVAPSQVKLSLSKSLRRYCIINDYKNYKPMILNMRWCRE